MSTRPGGPNQMPAPYPPADFEIMAACQNLAAGVADSYQQQLAISWLLSGPCAFTLPSFTPGDAPGTAEFNAGRHFVAQSFCAAASLAMPAFPKLTRKPPTTRADDNED